LHIPVVIGSMLDATRMDVRMMEFARAAEAVVQSRGIFKLVGVPGGSATCERQSPIPDWQATTRVSDCEWSPHIMLSRRDKIISAIVTAGIVWFLGDQAGYGNIAGAFAVLLAAMVITSVAVESVRGRK
jgi:hypothetical protein